jgi:hypothetical protein
MDRPGEDRPLGLSGLLWILSSIQLSQELQEAQVKTPAQVNPRALARWPNPAWLLGLPHPL